MATWQRIAERAENRIEELEKENQELLKALKELVNAIKVRTSMGHDIIHELIEAEKLIKKAEGEQLEKTIKQYPALTNDVFRQFP